MNSIDFHELDSLPNGFEEPDVFSPFLFLFKETSLFEIQLRETWI